MSRSGADRKGMGGGGVTVEDRDNLGACPKEYFGIFVL